MDGTSFSELILRQKIVAIVFIAVFILLTIELIRRRALKERYAILWMIAAFVLIPMVASHRLVAVLSGYLGIAYAPATILLTGILFLILINLHFSVALSRHKENESRLQIRLAEQGKRIEQLEQKIGQPADDGDPPSSDENS
jgi:small-conductance mechanosensitive channel